MTVRDKEVRSRIKAYKELKADIVDIDIKLTDTTNESEINELIKSKEDKEKQVRRIDNGISVLSDPHDEIVKEILINDRRYSYMQEKLHLSYSRVKQLEYEALEKISKYIL